MPARLISASICAPCRPESGRQFSRQKLHNCTANMPPKKKTDLGAGLRVSKDNVEDHPAGPPKFGELSQAERAFTLASTFLSGVLA
jgi:hypothetical protein